MAENPDRIREQIVETRERIVETAEALAYKADLRSRARERAVGTARSARERALRLVGSTRARAVGLIGSVREIPAGARDRLPTATVGAVALGLIAGLLIPLRRARRNRASAW